MSEFTVGIMKKNSVATPIIPIFYFLFIYLINYLFIFEEFQSLNESNHFVELYLFFKI